MQIRSKEFCDNDQIEWSAIKIHKKTYQYASSQGVCGNAALYYHLWNHKN